MDDEVLDEELHHALLVDVRVPLVGADLHLEALAGLLQRLDQLYRVLRMHVVVRTAITTRKEEAFIPGDLL